MKLKCTNTLSCKKRFVGSTAACICQSCYANLTPVYPQSEEAAKWREECENRKRRDKNESYRPLNVVRKEIVFNHRVLGDTVLYELAFEKFSEFNRGCFHSHCHMDTAVRVLKASRVRSDKKSLRIGPPLDKSLLNRRIVGLYLI